MDLSLKVDAGVMQAGILMIGAMGLVALIAWLKLPIFGQRREDV